MTSIQQQLQQWSIRNSELVKILSDTDYAPTALDQQKQYIEELKSSAMRCDQEIARATQKRIAEHKDHKKYNESILKRFSYKAIGQREKFEAKADKEEREYFDALQDEHKAKEQKKYIDQQLSDAVKAKTDLEDVAARNKDAQSELDALYNQIFSGPTPDLPQEDQVEFKATQALDQYRQTRAKWETEDQAIRILSDAHKTMNNALQAIDGALDYSTMDVWGGGTMTDMMERNELSRAQTLLSTVYMQYGQAQRLSPQLVNIPEIYIDQGHLMSEVLFDNLFTDLRQHDRIQQARDQMVRGAQHMFAQEKSCQDRASSTREQLKHEELVLLDARKELQHIRQQAFQDLAGPPAYS